MKDERQFVNVARICSVDDVLLVNVALIRNLALQLIANWFVASAHNDVWLNTARTKFGNAVLRWFRLLLTAWSNEWNQRDMHITNVVPANFVSKLSNRFKERQDLNVSNGATNFGDHYIDILGRQSFNSATNLVCHMRNNLHRATEVITSALSGKNSLINAASCGIR